MGEKPDGKYEISQLKSVGLKVAFVGKPNVGKSSLVNALGQSDRSIVTSVPGTTRDVVEVPVTIGGVSMILVDTAGMRETNDEVEAIGVERATREQVNADILLWLGAEDEKPSQPGVIQLLPKADLATARPDRGALAISTVTGEGLQALMQRLVSESAGRRSRLRVRICYTPGRHSRALER